MTETAGDETAGGSAARGFTLAGGVLLTGSPAQAAPYRGWMTVGADGRIAAMGPGEPPPTATSVTDVSGCLVAPGFVSAHSHLFTSGSRGLGTGHNLYGWIEAMTHYTRHATAEDVYWLTLHGAADFLANGITTAYDFTAGRLDFRYRGRADAHFSGELRGFDWVHQQLLAKLDSGIRFVHSFGLDENGIRSSAETVAAAEEMLALADAYRDVPRFAGAAISGAVQWAGSPEVAETEVEVMRRFGLINQAHFLENPYDLDGQREKFAWYRDAGALGPNLLFGHFIHTTPDMVADAAAAGCGMVWQPTSNGRLASGVTDIPRYRAAGLRIGVGLDDQSCTDISDPWQNLRVGLCLQRATTRDPTSLGVREMFELHTYGSAQVLGLGDQVGTLEPGKWADVLVVDPADPDTGPVWDPYATYVLACGLRNLKAVYVGGRLVSRDGRVLGVDQRRVSAEVHRRLDAIRARLGEPPLLTGTLGVDEHPRESAVPAAG